MIDKTRKKILLKLGLSRLVDPGMASHRDINKFTANPDNPFLVSFPRTGSHWLRMLMELYFERPSLTRSFYYHNRRDYLTLHTHDLDLSVQRTNVIYLYRDPVETIYSQLQYHRENTSDRARISYWSTLYGLHLDKWLHTESFIQKKTVLRYDRLKANLAEEFGRLCTHLGVTLETQRLTQVAAQVSKEHVKQLTTHDERVVNPTHTYADERTEFQNQQASLIWEVLLDSRPHLRQDF